MFGKHYDQFLKQDQRENPDRKMQDDRMEATEETHHVRHFVPVRCTGEERHGDHAADREQAGDGQEPWQCFSGGLGVEVDFFGHVGDGSIRGARVLNVNRNVFLSRRLRGRAGFAFFPHEGQPFPKIVTQV